MVHAHKKLQKTWNDFWDAYQVPESIKQDYIPNYFQSLLDSDSQTFSSKELKKIISRKGYIYISAACFQHRGMAHMYGDPSIHSDPKYKSLQHAESTAWLLIHLMDQSVEQMMLKNEKGSIGELINYVDSIVFSSPGKITIPEKVDADTGHTIQYVAEHLRDELHELKATEAFTPYWNALINSAVQENDVSDMKSYRERRRQVGTCSGDFCHFFITGAGDAEYANHHFNGKLENMRFTLRKAAEAETLFDSYLDFTDDKKEVLGNVPTRVGDRSWFLLETIVSLSSLIKNEQHKHLGHFSGLLSRSVFRVVKWPRVV